ncbi:MAG: CarD family transcriptional regulator [Clostridiales bacterium]|nr:CarD family transcriptional regulator [Clostridiales bacterium]
MFNVGDKVVYPMHGAGTIESIEEKDILGEKQAYYIIKMPGEVKVMVPTAKAKDVGVRDVINEETAGKVFKVLTTDSTEMSMNWNKRYRDNMEKMKSGDAYEIADVVRNLSFKQKEKGLSTGEKKMLLNAKQILVSELTLAQNAKKEEIEELVNNTINLSFAEYNKIDKNAVKDNTVKQFISFDSVSTPESENGSGTVSSNFISFTNPTDTEN